MNGLNPSLSRAIRENLGLLRDLEGAEIPSVADMIRDYEAMIVLIDDCQSELRAGEERQRRLRQRVGDKNIVIEQLQEQLRKSATDPAVQRLETMLKAARAEVDGAHRKINAMDDQLHDRTMQLKQARKNIDEKACKIMDLVADVDRLRRIIERQKGEITKLRRSPVYANPVAGEFAEWADENPARARDLLHILKSLQNHG